MALMSGKVYSDVGVPSNTIGEQGDIFMQLDGLKTTYRKEGVSWTPIGNQLGTIPEFLQGNGLPSNAVGGDGQYYRDVTTQAIYQKSAGVWNNVGSWTQLALLNQLIANGIGADLATTNWLTNVSLNDVTEVGEYYYSTGVTNSPIGVDAGMMKVWRLNANNVGQLVQPVIGSSYSPWHIRLRTGGTWGAWAACANQNGDPTRKFKALAGTANDDVAVVSQILGALSSTGYSFNPAENITLPTSLGGLTLKWGENTDSINNPAPVVFTNPFPNACFLVIPVSDSTTDNSLIEQVGISAKTVNGFNWHQSLSGTSSYVHGWWLAIGY